MKAIYYCEDSSPMTLFVVELSNRENLNKDDLILELIDQECPFPSSEIVLFSNNEEVDRISLNDEDKRKYFYFYSEMKGSD